MDLKIKRLGPCQYPSPLMSLSVGGHRFVGKDECILFEDRVDHDLDCNTPDALELAGPRRSLFFDPSEMRVGVVTCGGLCPGLNDVIRGLVMTCHYRYDIREIYGFRYGLQGFLHEYRKPPTILTPMVVEDIQKNGGTLLGSSRGPQPAHRIVDRLQEMGISILFLVGGEGTMRAALSIAEEVEKRDLPIALIGIPKTIDNDISFIDQSFGFETAFSQAVNSIYCAHTEARGVPNGIGLVKLMGRRSGFIAAHATLATSDVNFCLVPEIPFELDGESGLLSAVQNRLATRGHAVVVVAEGAGQNLLESEEAFDASGNEKLADIGLFLSRRFKDHFAAKDIPMSLKYIDPSYIIRSVPAAPADSVYCWRLAQNAVHAALAGRTEAIIGRWHGRLVHVPMAQVTSKRKQIDPEGDLWLSVLENTGQPPIMGREIPRTLKQSVEMV